MADSQRRGTNDYHRVGPAAAALFVAVPLVAFLAWLPTYLGLVSESAETQVLSLIKHGWWSFQPRAIEWVTSPFFWLGLPICLLLSARWPAQPGQPVLSRQLWHDAIWTVFEKCFLFTFGVWYVLFINQILADTFDIQPLAFAADLPDWAKLLLGFLVADFLGWLHHLIRHKVPLFWEFHAVHHSQTHMNPLTMNRLHPVDWLVAANVRLLPTFFFGFSLDLTVGYLALSVLVDLLSHSNIRTNYGPLRYILVTPQSHRIHHSSDPRHFDRNFGVILSIWDHLFGTQYRTYDEYPPTGVPDSGWPTEERTGAGSLRALTLQLLYPFSAVGRRAGFLSSTDSHPAKEQPPRKLG